MSEITATNHDGDLIKALKDAISEAENSAPHTDAHVKWKLEEVTGEKGSIAGKNEVTVKISYML